MSSLSFTKWSKYNVLPSTGAPRSSASRCVSPLPLPGDYDCGERDDENADHGHLLEMIVLFIKIQYVGSR